MRPVVDHVALRVRNLGVSRRFYEAALAPLGLGVLYSDEEGCGFGLESGKRDADDFWILEGDEPSTRVAFVLDLDGNNIEAVHHER